MKDKTGYKNDKVQIPEETHKCINPSSEITYLLLNLAMIAVCNGTR